MEEKHPFSVSKLKNKNIIIPAVIGLLAIGGFFYWKNTGKTTAEIKYVTQTAAKQTIVVSVTGTGQIAAENKVDIKPQTSGTVTSVKVKNGDMVKAGQTIATIDSRNAASTLTQTRASLEAAEANYQKVIAGPTDTTVTGGQLSVQSAQNNLKNAQDNLDQVKKQQEQNVQNAYRTFLNTSLAAAPSGHNLGTGSPTITGTYTGTQEGDMTITITTSGNSGTAGTQYFNVTGIENGSGLVSSTSPAPLGSHGLYIQFPSTPVYLSDSWTVSIPNTKASGYVANYNDYQTALQDQTDNIKKAEQSITSAELALEQAQNDYATKTEPATSADIASARAQVDSARAQLLNAETAYSNTIITAPFDGQITAINIQKGDQASSATAAATIITPQQIAQISLNEVDAAKIKPGQKATLSFDAIDGLTLTGHVGEIDAIGTVTQGVVTYNVKIALDSQDERIKPGMSVSASIILDIKTDVLAVPSSAVKSGNNGSYVQIMDQASNSSAGITGTPRQQTVETGMSNDTLTEITSGIKEGDNVVTQTINPSATKTTTTQTSGSLRIPGLTGGAGGGNFRATQGAGGR